MDILKSYPAACCPLSSLIRSSINRSPPRLSNLSSTSRGVTVEFAEDNAASHFYNKVDASFGHGKIVLTRGDVACEYLTLVIYSAPPLVHVAVDLRINRIKMTSPMPNALHPADPLAPDISSEHRAEPVPPRPHGFVTDIYAALEEQILEVPQREREADVRHDPKADDLRRRVKIPERISGLTGTGHCLTLRAAFFHRQRCHPFNTARTR